MRRPSSFDLNAARRPVLARGRGLGSARRLPRGGHTGAEEADLRRLLAVKAGVAPAQRHLALGGGHAQQPDDLGGGHPGELGHRLDRRRPLEDQLLRHPLHPRGEPVEELVTEAADARADVIHHAPSLPSYAPPPWRQPGRPTQLSGASHSTASGGRVNAAECGCPFHSVASATTLPRLPTPLPPYDSASVFTTSSHRPGRGRPTRKL